jgi:hypothetical protein
MEENIEDAEEYEDEHEGEAEEEVGEPRKSKRQEETKAGSKIPTILILALLLGAIAGALAGLAVQSLFAEEDEATPITIKDDNVGIGTTSPDTELDVDGVVSAGGGNSDQWNTAYSWGDHSTEGYLTSLSETDPVYGVSVSSGITSRDITNWDTAYGWDDHSTEGYLTSLSETDPVYGVSVASGITSGDITNWDTAFGWGDHAAVGYLTGESDPQVGTISLNYVSKWDGIALVTGSIFDNGNIGIGTASPSAAFHVDNGGLLLTGSTGSTPVSGAGTRMMWIPERAAFRAGYVGGTQWDEVNIGYYSTANGYNTTASGNYSIAMGYETIASSMYSTAMGIATNASGFASTAMGCFTDAYGVYSTATGYFTDANGDYSTAMGYDTDAYGIYSTAMGIRTNASGFNSIAMGGYTSASGWRSTAMGYDTDASGEYSTAMGFDTDAYGDYSTAMGFQTNASGYASTAMGRSINASGNYSVGIGLDNNPSGWTITQDNVMAIMGGNVGIGTTNPGTGLRLQVSGRIAAAWGSTISPTYRFGDGSEAAGLSSPISNTVVFITSGTERIRLTSSGYVGIGTATPTTELDVNGDISAHNMPGLEHTGADFDYLNVPNSWTNLQSVELTVNSAGYILVTFSGSVEIDTAGGWAEVGIDTTTTGYDTVQFVSSQDVGDMNPFSAQYVYQVGSAGTYTYYGNSRTSDGTADLFKCRMTAIYVPYRY